jgi:predicted short-subunit dehydrogenase-like oxidoreductase (DUF2520 family)
MTVAVIGLGRLGTSLARALAARGTPIAGFYDLDPRAAGRARRLLGRGRPASSAADAARPAEVVLICVPDRDVAAAAAELARAPFAWTGKIVLHTSGVHSSAVLAPLRRRGAATGSFHPAQSFARADTPPARFLSIGVAVEGAPRAAAAARTLARRLGAVPFTLKAADKPRYHAACAVASNLFIPLFDLACALLEETGLPRRRAERVLLPLVEGTAANIRKAGRENALTGPISRGDAATIDLHLRTLRGSAEAREIYLRLSRRALAIARERGLDPAAVKSIRRRLAGK